MRKNLKKAIIVYLTLLLSFSLNAQYRKRHQFLEGFKIQPKVGVNMFYGDLVSKKRTKYTFGVVAEKELTEYLNGRFDLTLGSMKGTQESAPGLIYAYFSNFFVQYNFGATFRPLDLAMGLFKERRFNPYVIGEIGIIQWRAREWFGAASGFEDGSPWRGVGYTPNADRTDFDSDGSWGFAPNISGGLGCSVFINSRISLNAEWVGSYTFTDKLDVHDVWYNGLQPDMTYEYEVQTAGNDFFYIGTIGATYLFGDSRWRNHPKYNRKAYIRTRSLYKPSKKKVKRPSRRKKTKRYGR